MLRIDRYTSVLFWSFFLASLLIVVTLFTAMEAMSLMVNYKDVSTQALFNYYSYSLPEIIYKMLPVACLIGVVMTLSNMNRSNELVALFASGMSLLRVARPSLIWIFCLSAIGYYASDKILPPLTRQKNYIFYNEIKKMPNMFSVVKTNRIWYKSKNILYNIKTLNPETAVAQGLSMYFFSDNWDLIQMISAESVAINGSQWELSKGNVTLFTAESSFPLNSEFKTKTLVMEEGSRDLSSSGQTSDMLSQGELSQFIKKNRDAGLDTLRYEVDYHSKFGYAFAGLVMSLLGIPFSVGRARSGGTLMNIGVSMALVFVYWVLYSSFLTLGSHAFLPPVVSAWLPSLIMGLFGLWLLHKIKR